MTTDQLESDAIAATTRIIARDGFDAFSLAAVAQEIGASREAIEAAFASERTLLNRMVVRSFGHVAERIAPLIDAAPTGSDALTIYIRSYTNHYLERIDEFRQAFMLRQIVGSERFGLNADETRAMILPLVNGLFDRLEAKLLADRARAELPGGIHPRRLAFSAHVIAVGLVLLRGTAAAAGMTLAHTDDVMIGETSRALGAAITGMRQLSALNDVAAELARFRKESELRAAVPRLLAKVLDLESTSFALRGEDMPSEAKRAMEEGRTFREGILATALRYEGEAAGALWGHAKPTVIFDERDIARMETFATMVGLSLENVRLYENMQGELDARAKKLSEAHVRLAESEKMAALGKLVAGVVHELNTPVASVLSSESTLVKAMEKLRSKVPAELGAESIMRIAVETAENIGTGARRISSIVQQLKRFSRLDAAERETIDVNASLTDAVALLRGEIPPACSVEMDLGELPPFTCLASRLNQVFLNVIRNAAQAIAERGTIRVRSLSSANELTIVIEDDGVGIAKDDLARIFEPGFSAKGGRVHAGLGLATSYQVIRDHKGEIRIDSEPGRGTKVTIVLPIPS